MKKCFTALLSIVLLAKAGALPDARYHTIPNPRPATEDLDYYGSAIVADSSYAIIGSPRAQAKGNVAEGGTVHVKIIGPASFYGQEFIHNPDHSGGGRFGSSLAISTHYILIGAPETTVSGTSLAGAAYLHAFTAPETTPAPLTNPNPEGFENFGTAVALSASFAIVSARGIQTAAAGSGIVHIYDRRGNGVSPYVVAFSIPNPTPASGEFFGASLALSGTRLIVGNPGDNEGRGSVYVYDLSAGWPTTPALVITNPMGTAENEKFGACLSLDGDKLAVGAPDGLGANGRAYVFNLAGTTPNAPVVSLANPDPFIWEAYGSSIALRADRLLVGCPADIQFGNFIGSAYEYNLASASPTSVVYHFQSPDPAVAGGEGFGAAVAFGGTNYSERLVAAPGNDRLLPDAGDVHAFRFVAPSSMTSSTKASHVTLPPDHEFGNALALHGDKLFVGAFKADSPGYSAPGEVYVYNLISPTPEQPEFSIPNPEPDEEDWFGRRIAVSGSRLVISAPYDSVSSRMRVGTVYVYDLNSASPYTPMLEIPSPDISYQALFGATLALDGDILVCGGNLGVYAFDLSSNTPTLPLAKLAGSGQSSRSLSVSGRRVAVGNFASSAPGLQVAGVVTLHDLDSSTPASYTHLFLPPAPREYGAFGHTVFLEDDNLLISARSVADRLDKAGAVYVYSLASATPTVPLYELADPMPREQGQFGHDVTLSGTKVLCSKVSHAENGVLSLGTSYLYGLQRPLPAEHASVLPSEFTGYYIGISFQTALNSKWAAVSRTLQNSESPRGGVVCVYGTPIPEIIIEQPSGVSLTDGNSTIDFGYGVQNVAKPLPLIVRNVGIHALEISELNFATGNNTDFSHSVTGLPLIIAAGGQTSIQINFTGGTLGARTTELRILNNDEDEGPFNIRLDAYSVTERQGWRYQHFGTIDNTGDAANQADPDGDGFTNSDEFLTGTVPVDALSRLRLEIQPHPTAPNQMRLLISPARTTVSYRVEVNTSLSPSGWQTLWEVMGSGQSEMPLNDSGSAGQSARFYRLTAN